MEWPRATSVCGDAITDPADVILRRVGVRQQAKRRLSLVVTNDAAIVAKLDLIVLVSAAEGRLGVLYMAKSGYPTVPRKPKKCAFSRLS
jgi:hypothetical protein